MPETLDDAIGFIQQRIDEADQEALQQAEALQAGRVQSGVQTDLRRARVAQREQQAFEQDNQEGIGLMRTLGPLGRRVVSDAGGAALRLVSTGADILGRAQQLVDPGAMGRSDIQRNLADPLAQGLRNLDRASAIADAEQDLSATVSLPFGEADLSFNRATSSMVRSISDALAGGGIAKALGIPSVTAARATIGSFALQAAAGARRDAEEAGLSPGEADSFAARAGLIEGAITSAMQRIGLGGFEDFSGTVGKALLRSGAGAAGGKALAQLSAEQFEEITIEVINAINEQLSGVDPNALDPERLQQRIVDTVLATTLTVGAARAPQAISAGRRFARRQQERAEREAQLIDPPDPDAEIASPAEPEPDPDAPLPLVDTQAVTPVDGSDPITDTTGTFVQPDTEAELETLRREQAETIVTEEGDKDRLLARVDTVSIEENYPGSAIEQTEDGWSLTMEDGSRVDVVAASQVAPLESLADEIQRQREVDGRPISREQALARAQDVSVPGVTLRVNGSSTNAAAIMALDAGIADEGTLGHESFHVMQTIHPFSEGQLQGLDDLISQGAESGAPKLLRTAHANREKGGEQNTEEAYANALEYAIRTAATKPTWWRQFLDKLKALIGAQTFEQLRQNAQAAVSETREAFRENLRRRRDQRRAALETQETQAVDTQPATEQPLPTVEGAPVSPPPAKPKPKPADDKLPTKRDIARQTKEVAEKEARLAELEKELKALVEEAQAEPETKTKAEKVKIARERRRLSTAMERLSLIIEQNNRREPIDRQFSLIDRVLRGTPGTKSGGRRLTREEIRERLREKGLKPSGPPVRVEPGQKPTEAAAEERQRTAAAEDQGTRPFIRPAFSLIDTQSQIGELLAQTGRDQGKPAIAASRIHVMPAALFDMLKTPKAAVQDPITGLTFVEAGVVPSSQEAQQAFKALRPPSVDGEVTVDLDDGTQATMPASEYGRIMRERVQKLIAVLDCLGR